MTALELMLVLDRLLSETGTDIPIVFRDDNPSSQYWFKPVRYYGPVNIVENDKENPLKIFGKHQMFMLSDVRDAFPSGSYVKDNGDRDA